MSDYSPPTEDLPIFDVTVFNSGDEPLTYNQAKKKFLRYPIAQGKETLQTIDVNGIATFKNTTIFQDGINNTSIDQVSTNFIIDNNGAGGQIILKQSKLGGLERTVMTLDAETGCIINKQSDETPNATTLKLNDPVSNRFIGCIVNSQGDGLFNPLVRTFDSVIYGGGTLPNTQSLTLTSNSSTASGVRITPTSSLIGFGSFTTTPTNSLLCDNTGCTISGITNFTSTSPPTSSQIIPVASDSSTNIPTTSWVQSAIDAKTTIVETNTDATFYPVFVSAIGNQSFRADTVTTPWFVNPSTGIFRFANTIKIDTSLRTAFGENAGLTGQMTAATAIGRNAGQINQGTQATAVGQLAGSNYQSQFAVAIGSGAGAGQSITNFQGDSGIAVGHEAGRNFQASNCIAIGKGAGIGNAANSTSGQKINSIAIGTSAGAQFQNDGSIAIGNLSGNTSQSSFSVAIGQFSGQTSQGSGAVAIGNNAGNSTQGVDAIAIGEDAGGSGQTLQAVALGYGSGFSAQGNYAVAIGARAGRTSQHNNSIILNASGSDLNSDGTSRFYVKPIRNTTQTNVLGYNTTTSEVSYYTLTFSYAQFNSTFSATTLAANSSYDIMTVGISTIVNSGITFSGGWINLNKIGVFKVGISLLAEESGGSGVELYFCWVDATGVIANSGSVVYLNGNNAKSLAYAEILYNSTSVSATIKPRVFTTSSGISIKQYAAPDITMASNPALIATVYQVS